MFEISLSKLEKLNQEQKSKIDQNPNLIHTSSSRPFVQMNLAQQKKTCFKVSFDNSSFLIQDENIVQPSERLLLPIIWSRNST